MGCNRSTIDQNQILFDKITQCIFDINIHLHGIENSKKNGFYKKLKGLVSIFLILTQPILKRADKLKKQTVYTPKNLLANSLLGVKIKQLCNLRIQMRHLL
jgi:hypothetical protein